MGKIVTTIITWQSKEILLLPKSPIPWFTIQVTRTPVRHRKYKTGAWLPILGNHPRAIIGTPAGDSEYSDYLTRISSKRAFKAAFEMLRRDQWVCLICFCAEYEKCHRRVLLNWLVENYPEDFRKYESFALIEKVYKK